MKHHTNKHLRRALALFMTVLMAMSCFSATFGVISFAAADGSTLIGRYFSTDNVWYDAAKGANGIQWQIGDYPAYNASLGMTYFNGMYVRIDNNTLFQNVNRDTGVTFAFNYRPNFTGDHRHILSLGQNAYGDGTKNQFFISGTTSWYSDGNFPVVAWVNGSDQELIKAFPQNFSPVLGREYNIVVTVDKDAGVIFYIDGEKKTTVYKDSNLNDQIGNIRSFLDEVNTYDENYIGCSRWTADAKIEGYLSDVRIYKTSVSDTGAYSLVSDMAGSSFDLSKPSFNATAYHYNDPATGAYSNLAYSSPATTEDSGMGIRGADNSDDYKDIYAVYFKFFTPLNVVMVYDGDPNHETYASIELETKRHNKANVQDQRIYYVVSNSSLLKTRHNWYGYLDSAWKTWAGAYTANQINTDTNLDVYVGSTNDTPRFWWNALKYTGTGNNDTYYDHEQNVSFTLQAFYDYTLGTTSKGTGTITTLSNYYVLNYKPVYDVLDAASAKYNDEMNGKAWMYTEQSYAKAMLAMRRLALCNPNLYDYDGRGVDAAAQMSAAAIKQAITEYNAINLVKKTGTVTFNYENGTEFQTYNVLYGDAITVPAVPTKTSTVQYDYINPVWSPAIEAGTVMNDDYKDKVFTASYTESLRSYDITWNYTTADGQQSVTTQVNYGTMPTAPEAATNDYQTDTADFTFTGWSPSLVQVEGVKTYIAQYSSTPRTYSITYKDGDTILTGIEPMTYTCGTGAAINGTYSKAGYTFNGWKDENGDPVTTILGNVYGDITLYADLTIHQHNIVWKNGDETVKTDANQNYGTQAVWSGDMPTTADAQYTYTAIGWNTDPDATTALDTLPTLGDEDLTLYAIYDKNDETHRTTNTYPVTITAGANTTLTVKNGDAVLASGDEVPYGTVLTIEAALAPAYTQNGTLSVTVNDEAYTATTYTVTSATTIATAPVENVPKNTYTIIWQDQWEKELSRATVEHGSATIMPLNDPADVRIEDKVYTFSGWDNGLTGGQSVYVTEDTTITANYTLTDQVAKYTVTFLNDDNSSVIATAEYEYNAAVVIPGTPVSTNRTKELDYTFTGWTPEVAATVTADATYVATYETEAHSRLYPVKWVYGDDNTVAKEENLPYNTVFTAAAIPADVITKDDDVTHNVHSWSQYSDKRLENYIGNTTTEVLIHADSSLKRHTGEPAYEWVGNDADGYTKCIGTMTCTACGEVLRVEASFTQPTTTHTGENCQDRSYTSYLASLSGSGANSYFENQTKKVNGDYGPHNFSHYYTDNEPTYNWTYTDKTHVSCVATQKCYYCDAVDTETGTVSEADVQQDANCAQPEKSEYTATFERFELATKMFETAPIEPDAHDYSPYTLDEERTVRPVYDEATGTWSKATLVYNCDNTYDYDTHGYDHAHDKVVENVDRADYSEFDEAYEKFVSIAELDIADDTLVTVEQYGSTQQIPFSYVKNQVERAIDNADELPLDYTTTHTNDEWDEQQNVNNMVEQLNYFINMVFNDDGTVKDGLLNTYTITFVTDGSPVTDITGALKGDEIALPETTKDGFHFEGWYTDESHADGTKAADPYTVTGDATLYAFFEELSLNGDDVEAAIAAATAGVSGICYTEESYTAYTNAVAAVRAFKDQSATTENLAAYNNALSALDAAVAGLVAEHAYTGDPVITRPVYDEATGTWSKGVKTWTCANNADHPVKTEEVDRADYTTYDSVLEQISNLLNEDLTDDVKAALEDAKTALEAIAQNYIEDEQTTLDSAIQTILDTLNGNDKITVDENGTITVDPDTAYKTYKLTLTNNVNTDYMEFTQKAGTQAHLNPTLAGYTLKGFSENANYNAETGIYTFPTADDTITALFVKDLTDNVTITGANAIIADETNPDSGKDYDDTYIAELNGLLDEINNIKDDPAKLDELNEKLEDLQTLVDKAEQNRVYTITWSIDGVETTETYKVGDTPTHAAPTKDGFRFTGWEPAIVAVTGDTTYTAVFTEASAEPAYYAEYDAVYAKLETVPTNDKVTAELKAEAQDKLAHPLDRNLTADQQQIIDDEVAAIRAILDKIFEKDSNGNYTDDVKDGAAVKYTVVFHWLGATLTRTVVSGKGAKGPDLTRLYGVEGMEGGHFVFNRWVKDSEDSGIPADITNVTENMDVYAEYKQEAHTGAWIEHEATCSRVAYKEIDCTLCGLHFEVNTGSEKAPHDWKEVRVEPTCAHPGRITRTCKNDPSHTEYEVIPQLPHTDANGDTICDVCGNPTENHQHTDVNGDGKCDTCGATTDAHVHNYQNGVCTGCGQTQDGSFRCNLCSVYEQYRHIPVAGWFLTAFHFFYHLVCQITSWR